MSDPQEAATPHPTIGDQTMTYVGEFCGAVSKADRPTRTDTSTIRLRP